MSKNELEKLRTQIDRIDDKLLLLFEERMRTAKQIADYKKENKIEVVNKEREKEVVTRLSEKVPQELAGYVQKLYKTLFELSRDYQNGLIFQKKYGLIGRSIKCQAKEVLMVVVVKKNPDKEQFENLTNWLKSLGVTLHISEGESNLVLGLVGDTSSVDIDLIRSLAIVEDVKRIQEPYKNANRKFHPEDSIIKVADGVEFGGGTFNIIDNHIKF